ncbi:MAG: hypothetical protein UU77_C0031G0003 [candidate division WWE3 bacterium GW2011_GWC1_41_7]|uniref:DUF948 domain-containing protein n=4 Tax=Katanobacteria TaxID=422282 RepID=A0A0G0X584_UNCKA|nr:MAG: hypothetical protein UU72_C0024G0023 [candidate division WWE3 bacterium GW2011_GWB1_41_6]KKS20120.1 MAG: hypothetical protein UU77_C0031G0003 [candidate division WWE3 bacterium GW2011_GWC1_41_7]KKS22137.1 MAG: hypothetical protein UU80_C0013G0031 [candidate division WWE3 bacterium GW2011_GWA1_41_8]OGC57839.1 MAG: hypothetical protein A2976_01985 [candidate division WWE3 bacterium RIFCSPLOWO2_01_FULL_41_9]
MDLQVVLIFILALLTINLMIVGFYVILVLKEFRETIKKSNSVLDNVHKVSDAVTSPISSLAGIVSGIAEGVKTVRAISSLRDVKEKEDEDYV